MNGKRNSPSSEYIDHGLVLILSSSHIQHLKHYLNLSNVMFQHESGLKNTFPRELLEKE